MLSFTVKYDKWWPTCLASPYSTTVASPNYLHSCMSFREVLLNHYFAAQSLQNLRSRESRKFMWSVEEYERVITNSQDTSEKVSTQ